MRLRPFLDKNTHDGEKGIKPGVHAHFAAGDWACSMHTMETALAPVQYVRVDVSPPVGGLRQETVHHLYTLPDHKESRSCAPCRCYR